MAATKHFAQYSHSFFINIPLAGLYARHLPRWLDRFPLGDRLHVVDGDNLVKRPWEELEKVQVRVQGKKQHFPCSSAVRTFDIG